MTVIMYFNNNNNNNNNNYYYNYNNKYKYIRKESLNGTVALKYTFLTGKVFMTHYNADNVVKDCIFY